VHEKVVRFLTAQGFVGDELDWRKRVGRNERSALRHSRLPEFAERLEFARAISRRAAISLVGRAFRRSRRFAVAGAELERLYTEMIEASRETVAEFHRL
jgi:hypothetical protein